MKLLAMCSCALFRPLILHVRGCRYFIFRFVFKPALLLASGDLTPDLSFAILNNRDGTKNSQDFGGSYLLSTSSRTCRRVALRHRDATTILRTKFHLELFTLIISIGDLKRTSLDVQSAFEFFQIKIAHEDSC